MARLFVGSDFAQVRTFDAGDLRRLTPWATDAHKWPMAGYDSGLAIVEMRCAAGFDGHYGRRTIDPVRVASLCSHSGASGARGGVELWANAEIARRLGLCAHDRANVRTTRSGCPGASRRRASKVLNDVVINQVLVSFGRPEVTREVIRRVQEDGPAGAAEQSGTGEDRDEDQRVLVGNHGDGRGGAVYRRLSASRGECRAI